MKRLPKKLKKRIKNVLKIETAVYITFTDKVFYILKDSNKLHFCVSNYYRSTKHILYFCPKRINKIILSSSI